MDNKRVGRSLLIIAKILTSPKEAFTDTNKKSFWIAFFSLVFGTMIIRYLYFPFYQNLMVSSLRVTPSPGAVQLARQSTHALTVFSTLTSPLSLTIEILFMSVVIWLVLQLLSSDPGFSRVLSMVVFCQIVLFLASVLTIVVLYIRGSGSVTNIANMEVSFGIDLIFSNSSFNAVAKKILSQINLFSIWWAVLIYTGLIHVAGLSRSKSILVTSFLWSLRLCIQIGLFMLTSSITKMGGKAIQ